MGFDNDKTLGFVFGLLGLIANIIPFLFPILGLVYSNRALKVQHDGMAEAGKIMGIIGIVLHSIALAFLLVFFIMLAVSAAAY